MEDKSVKILFAPKTPEPEKYIKVVPEKLIIQQGKQEHKTVKPGQLNSLLLSTPSKNTSAAETGSVKQLEKKGALVSLILNPPQIKCLEQNQVTPTLPIVNGNPRPKKTVVVWPEGMIPPDLEGIKHTSQNVYHKTCTALERAKTGRQLKFVMQSNDKMSGIKEAVSKATESVCLPKQSRVMVLNSKSPLDQSELVQASLHAVKHFNENPTTSTSKGNTEDTVLRAPFLTKKPNQQEEQITLEKKDKQPNNRDVDGGNIPKAIYQASRNSNKVKNKVTPSAYDDRNNSSEKIPQETDDVERDGLSLDMSCETEDQDDIESGFDSGLSQEKVIACSDQRQKHSLTGCGSRPDCNSAVECNAHNLQGRLENAPTHGKNTCYAERREGNSPTSKVSVHNVQRNVENAPTHGKNTRNAQRREGNSPTSKGSVHNVQRNVENAPTHGKNTRYAQRRVGNSPTSELSVLNVPRNVENAPTSTVNAHSVQRNVRNAPMSKVNAHGVQRNVQNAPASKVNAHNVQKKAELTSSRNPTCDVQAMSFQITNEQSDGDSNSLQTQLHQKSKHAVGSSDNVSVVHPGTNTSQKGTLSRVPLTPGYSKRFSNSLKELQEDGITSILMRKLGKKLSHQMELKLSQRFPNLCKCKHLKNAVSSEKLMIVNNTLKCIPSITMLLIGGQEITGMSHQGVLYVSVSELKRQLLVNCKQDFDAFLRARPDDMKIMPSGFKEYLVVNRGMRLEDIQNHIISVNTLKSYQSLQLLKTSHESSLPSLTVRDDNFYAKKCGQMWCLSCQGRMADESSVDLYTYLDISISVEDQLKSLDSEKTRNVVNKPLSNGTKVLRVDRSCENRTQSEDKEKRSVHQKVDSVLPPPVVYKPPDGVNVEECKGAESEDINCENDKLCKIGTLDIAAMTFGAFQLKGINYLSITQLQSKGVMTLYKLYENLQRLKTYPRRPPKFVEEYFKDKNKNCANSAWIDMCSLRNACCINGMTKIRKFRQDVIDAIILEHITEHFSVFLTVEDESEHTDLVILPYNFCSDKHKNTQVTETGETFTMLADPFNTNEQGKGANAFKLIITCKLARTNDTNTPSGTTEVLSSRKRKADSGSYEDDTDGRNEIQKSKSLKETEELTVNDENDDSFTSVKCSLKTEPTENVGYEFLHRPFPICMSGPIVPIEPSSQILSSSNEIGNSFGRPIKEEPIDTQDLLRDGEVLVNEHVEIRPIKEEPMDTQDLLRDGEVLVNEHVEVRPIKEEPMATQDLLRDGEVLVDEHFGIRPIKEEPLDTPDLPRDGELLMDTVIDVKKEPESTTEANTGNIQTRYVITGSYEENGVPVKYAVSVVNTGDDL